MRKSIGSGVMSGVSRSLLIEILNYATGVVCLLEFRMVQQMDADSSMCYLTNGYTSPFYYGGYHDPRFGYDGMWSPVPWYDGTTFANGQQRPAAASSTSFVTSNVENNTSSRNQNLHLSHSSHGVFQ
ncbi:hypothetical protein Cni_G16701 [Canna indica]|uniref:Uncharacterized protein n=1 Tax=Canna indica TaxID=4628 RepID=A0AAQ3QFW6_9LILI|nr:hypothetical protein Cni_G16701 [Canna indica]